MSTIYLGGLRITPSSISTLLDGPLPVSVLIALSGRRLDEVIDHPDVTGSWLGSLMIQEANQSTAYEDQRPTLYLRMDADAYALINKEFFSD